MATFGEDGALTNAEEAIGELVNTTGAGLFAGYYNDPQATDARLRHGMYWSGDLAYRDADGGSTSPGAAVTGCASTGRT